MADSSRTPVSSTPLVFLLIALVGGVLVSSGYWLLMRDVSSMRVQTVIPSAPSSSSLLELVGLTSEKLAQTDIGLMNLTVAGGLRGSEGMERAPLLADLDRKTARVKVETKRHLPRFQRTPHEFNVSVTGSSSR